ncbi:MAG TPA: hypothetical protein VGC30_13050, partial [Dokdonella sp.]
MSADARAADAPLLAQLRELDAALRAADVAYMVIGGLAVNVHGYVRATRDLDVMLALEDSAPFHAVLERLG